MNKLRILIAENKISVAERIKIDLIHWGYQVVGIANTGQKAKRLYLKEQPHLTLIDIHLEEPNSGIDLAIFIRQQDAPQAFIFLCTQINSSNIDLIKQTLPASCLLKPIQKENLYAAIEIARYKQLRQGKSTSSIVLSENDELHSLSVEDIIYLQADHVYLHVYTNSFGKIVQRSALSNFMEQLPAEQFVQTHRSFAVNTRHVKRWDKQYLYLGDTAVPLSRSRRKKVLSLINSS